MASLGQRTDRRWQRALACTYDGGDIAASVADVAAATYIASLVLKSIQSSTAKELLK
jgi:hypothetical protein